MLFECMGICVLSLAHESEMRGYLGYLLIFFFFFTFLINFVQIQLQYIRLEGLIVDFFFFFLKGEGYLKTCLEGSVDYIIYMNYIANRRSFISCSLARQTRQRKRWEKSIREWTGLEFAKSPSPNGQWKTEKNGGNWL